MSQTETSQRVAEIMGQTGCSQEIAEECIAKRPGNDAAQVALASLKMPVAKPMHAGNPIGAPAVPSAKAMRGYEVAGAARCDCCGLCLPLNRNGFCAGCTRKGSRMWLKGRSKFNAKPVRQRA